MTVSTPSLVRTPLKVMRTPRTVDVEITSRCNLRCRYCYYFDNPSVAYRDLPTEDWLAFFDELGRCAVMDVLICGGEPFIREDLADLLDGIVANGMRFSILSNGSLVTDEIAAHIAATGRCDFVQVSIDGPTAEVHDRFRGRGAFERAVRGIRTLQRHGVPVTSRMTIHSGNVDALEETARFLLEELGLNDFSTNAAGYHGSCRTQSREILLGTAERQKAMETLLRLEEKYSGRITAMAGPLAEARMWGAMESVLRGEKVATPGKGYLTGCGCPESRISVRSDGTYIPCSFLPHLELGAITTDPLADIWQQSPDLDTMRRRREIPLSSFEECGDCRYRSSCTGNCPGTAFALTGEIDRPSPDACLRRFLAEGGQIPGFEDIREAQEDRVP